MLDLSTTEQRLFQVSGDKVFIGGEAVTEQIRGVLRDQARSFQTSQLWEILDATIRHEAMQMALIRSAEWEHVLSAKQLHHYAHVVRNIIHTLAK